MTATLYDVLGVAPTATAEQLRRAYVVRARRHHPDAGGDAGAMRELNQAWSVLSDPIRRRTYDLQLGVRDLGDPPAGEEARLPFDVDPRDLLDTRAVTGTPRRGLLPLIPPALFVLSVGLGSVALVLDSPPMLGVAAVVFFLSCVSVAAVAMWMLRSSSRS